MSNASSPTSTLEPTSPVSSKVFDHLGYSRIASYLECPLKYKLTYVDGKRQPGGVPMRRGQAYHGTLEWLLDHKREFGRLLSADIADRIAVKNAKKEALTESETYRVVDAVRFYHSELYPKHRPLEVEGDFTITRGGVKITGRLDLVEKSEDGKGLWIVDHKFSYDTWAEDRARYGCQPMVYQWAGDDVVSPKYGLPYLGFRYNIIRLFPTPVIQVIEIPRIPQAASDWWEEQVAAIAEAIKAGHFPAHAQEKACKWCDHKKSKDCKPCIYKIKVGMLGDLSDIKDCD